VREDKTGQVFSASAEIASETVRNAKHGISLPLPPIGRFSVKDRRLIRYGQSVAKAEEVLYQCNSDGFDLAVVREKYNSFSNPLIILSALSGHPIQVSKIKLVAVNSNGAVWEHELAREPASYNWSAQIGN
jgi:hypothetical protein